MSKAVLKFNLEDEEDRKEFKRANKATDMYIALWDISQEIFRPARKHGYSSSRIEKLFDACGETEDGYTTASELVGELEELFWSILDDHDINLDGLS